MQYYPQAQLFQGDVLPPHVRVNPLHSSALQPHYFLQQPIQSQLQAQTQLAQSQLQLPLQASTYSSDSQTQVVPQVVQSKVVRHVPIVTQQRIIRVPPSGCCDRPNKSESRKVIKIKRARRREKSSSSSSASQLDFKSLLEELKVQERPSEGNQKLEETVKQLKRTEGELQAEVELLRREIKRQQEYIELLEGRRPIVVQSLRGKQFDNQINYVQSVEPVFEQGSDPAQVNQMKLRIKMIEQAIKAKTKSKARPKKVKERSQPFWDQIDQDELQRLRDQNQQLQQEKDRLKSEIRGKGRQESNIFQDEFSRARERQERQEKELGEKQRQLGLMEKQHDSLKQQMHSVTLNLNFKQNQANSLKKENESQQQRIAQLERSLRDLDLIPRLKNRIRELESALSSQPISEEDRPREPFKKRSLVLQDYNFYEEEDNQNKEAQLKRLRAQLAEALQQRAQKQKQLGEKSQIQFKLNYRIMELQSELKLNARLLELEQEARRKLQAALALANQKAAKVVMQPPKLQPERPSEDLRREVSRLQDELSRKERQIKSQQSHWESEVRKCRERESDLSDQIEELKEQLRQMKEKLAEWQRKAKQAEERFLTVKKSNSELVEKVKVKGQLQARQVVREQPPRRSVERKFQKQKEQLERSTALAAGLQKALDQLKPELQEMKFKYQIQQRSLAASLSKEKDRERELGQLAAKVKQLQKQGQKLKYDKVKCDMEAAVKEQKLKGLVQDLTQKQQQREKPKPPAAPISPTIQECKNCKLNSKKLPQKKKSKSKAQLKESIQNQLRLKYQNRELSQLLNAALNDREDLLKSLEQKEQPVEVVQYYQPNVIVEDNCAFEEENKRLKARIRGLNEERERLALELSQTAEAAKPVAQPQPQIVRPQIHQIIQEVVPTIHQEVIVTEQGYDPRNPCNNYIVKAASPYYSQAALAQSLGQSQDPMTSSLYQSYYRPMQPQTGLADGGQGFGVQGFGVQSFGGQSFGGQGLLTSALMSGQSGLNSQVLGSPGQVGINSQVLGSPGQVGLNSQVLGAGSLGFGQVQRWQ